VGGGGPGLLAWIVDKYYRWTDCKGNLESVISKDELLTIVSLYWFTNTINTSIRLYYEFMHTDGALRMLRLKKKEVRAL
jgi:epoxide hydrolase